MTPNGMTIGTVHTYNDLHMIPKHKIIIAPPLPKMEFENAMGVRGGFDHTEFLMQRVPLKDRRGSIEFLVLHGNTDYWTIYNQCKIVFNGTRKNVVLDDDPDFTYKGRWWVSDWKSYEGHSSIVVDYIVDTYRYSDINIETMDWMFDETIEQNLDIYYGVFVSPGKISRTLLNPTSEDIKPQFTCSGAMTVEKDGVTYRLPEGTTTEPGFVLEPGENLLKFTGTGLVSMNYDLGKQL